MTMTTIRELTDRLLAHPDENAIVARRDVANLITKSLIEVRSTLGYWEKTHFKLAIQNLRKNIWLLDESSTMHLGASMLCIEGAHVAEGKRNIAFATRDMGTEALTWEDLMTSIRGAQREIDAI